MIKCKLGTWHAISIIDQARNNLKKIGNYYDTLEVRILH